MSRSDLSQFIKLYKPLELTYFVILCNDFHNNAAYIMKYSCLVCESKTPPVRVSDRTVVLGVSCQAGHILSPCRFACGSESNMAGYTDAIQLQNLNFACQKCDFQIFLGPYRNRI